MTAQEFLNWMETVGFHKAVQVSDALGISRNNAQEIVADVKAGRDIKVKRTVALAMSAIAQGLKPWDEYER